MQVHLLEFALQLCSPECSYTPESACSMCLTLLLRRPLEGADATLKPAPVHQEAVVRPTLIRRIY